MIRAWLRHAVMAALAASLAAPGAGAAELYGVAMPERREVDGVPLLLDGIGEAPPTNEWKAGLLGIGRQ